MIKKIFYWIFTIFQVILLISAYEIQYFSMKKMGMMRYIVYQNQSWNTEYPITLLQHASIGFLILMAAISIILYLKKGGRIYGKMALPMLAGQMLLTVIFVFFTLKYSTSSYRAYYFICMITALTALIQAIKVFAYYIIKNV